MSEVIEKFDKIKNELEDLLYKLIEMYKSEKNPRKRLSLERIIRHMLRACAEVYQSKLIIEALYLEKVVGKHEGSD